MKIFRKGSNTPTTSTSSSKTETPPSPLLSDTTRQLRNSFGSTASPNPAPRSPRAYANTVTAGGIPTLNVQTTAPRDGQISPRASKHNIRIGDTRVVGRVICRAQALYDYPLDGDTLQIEDEEIQLLRFKKGDVINVHEQDSSGWWAGEFNNVKGIFPGSYMQVIEELDSGEKDSPIHDQVQHLQLQVETLLRDKRISNDFLDPMNPNSPDAANLQQSLRDRDEELAQSRSKIAALESQLMDVSHKLSTKDEDILALELEAAAHRDKAKKQNSFIAKSSQNETKIPQLESQLRALNGQLQEERENKKEIQSELNRLKIANIAEPESRQELQRQLEKELKEKAEMVLAIQKIDKIFQGIINKDDSSLSVPQVKELLAKLRKGLQVYIPHK